MVLENQKINETDVQRKRRLQRESRAKAIISDELCECSMNFFVFCGIKYGHLPRRGDKDFDQRVESIQSLIDQQKRVFKRLNVERD